MGTNIHAWGQGPGAQARKRENFFEKPVFSPYVLTKELQRASGILDPGKTRQ